MGTERVNIQNTQDIRSLRDNLAGLQTSEYSMDHPAGASEQFSASDLYLFPMDKVQHELSEIREEVEETCSGTDDVSPIPESVYNETFDLLKQIHRNVPIPDMMWLEDGGIGLEWRPPDGIATMSLYGDGLVVYGAFFNKDREISGICSLTDTAFFQGFLTTLTHLFQ